MSKLTAVIKASAAKQEKMMKRLGELNKMAAQRKHSQALGDKMKGLNDQIQSLGTIKKLSDVASLGLDSGGGGTEASPPTVTFTPPSMETLKSMKLDKAGDEPKSEL